MCLLQLAVTFLGFSTCNTDVSKTSVPKHIFPQSENNKGGEGKARRKTPFLLFSFRSFSTSANEGVATVTTYVTRKGVLVLKVA